MGVWHKRIAEAFWNKGQEELIYGLEGSDGLRGFRVQGVRFRLGAEDLGVLGLGCKDLGLRMQGLEG